MGWVSESEYMATFQGTHLLEGFWVSWVWIHLKLDKAPSSPWSRSPDTQAERPREPNASQGMHIRVGKGGFKVLQSARVKNQHYPSKSLRNHSTHSWSKLQYSLPMGSWQSVFLCFGFICNIVKHPWVLCWAAHAVAGLLLEARFYWGRGGWTQLALNSNTTLGAIRCPQYEMSGSRHGRRGQKLHVGSFTTLTVHLLCPMPCPGESEARRTKPPAVTELTLERERAGQECRGASYEEGRDVLLIKVLSEQAFGGKAGQLEKHWG